MELDISFNIIAMALLAIFAAAFVQTSLGIGFGLTAGPLLALLDPQLVPAPVLFLSGVTAGLGAWNERINTVWKEVAVGLFGRIVGTTCALGVLLLFVDVIGFELIFGILIAFAVILSSSGWRLRFNIGNLWSMAYISGFMGTITSVGAPPLALIYQNHNPAVARPTLATFFTFGCVVSFGGLCLIGRVDWHDMLFIVTMAPAMFMGIFVARRFATSIVGERYRKYLLVIAGIAAIILIYKGIEKI